MTIKAIPTVYRGVQMRSKLEAAWAEWLDKHSVRWAYEAEGFDIDGTWYLPDFWLPQHRAIIEVKGALDHPSLDKTKALAAQVSDDWNPDVLVLVGTAPVSHLLCVHPFLGDDIDINACDTCGSVIFRHEGSYACRVCGRYDGDGHLVPLHWYETTACVPACAMTPYERAKRWQDMSGSELAQLSRLMERR